MIKRFLRYSMEHKRKITLMISDEKGIRRISVQVTRVEDENVFYASGKSGKEKQLRAQDILSAAYARGDDGDTLKNEGTAN